MQTMTRRVLGASAVTALAFAMACGEADGPRSPATEEDQEAVASARADHVAVAATDEADILSHGEAVFNQICTACHTVQPPPNLAPPMMGISGHYHDAFTDKDEAVAWMVAYIQSPDSAKSKLSPEAFRRFGAMAPLPLPEEDLRAVMTWVWEMYDPELDPRPAGERTGDGGP
jgi:mono/diheme cytochrome c family protein